MSLYKCVYKLIVDIREISVDIDLQKRKYQLGILTLTTFYFIKILIIA